VLRNIAFVGGATAAVVTTDFILWSRSLIEAHQIRNDRHAPQHQQEYGASSTFQFDPQFSNLHPQSRSSTHASPIGKLPVDPPPSNASGGCLAVFSSGLDVIMQHVSFHNCSAVFGGGAFVLASSVSQTNVTATGNTARQGGGCMLYCNASVVINSTFLNNSVATVATSSLDIIALNIVNLTSASDFHAAAGGALWLLSLTSMHGCTFSGNSAIAVSSEVSYNNVTATFVGSHALGSSIFAFGTQVDAVMKGNVVLDSTSRCTGWCLAAGAVTVTSSLGITITDNVFSGCSAVALADVHIPIPHVCNNSSCSFSGPSFAIGAALAVLSSDGVLSLQNISFKSCTVNATGWAFGGALILGISKIKFGYTAIGLYFHSTLAVCSTFPCFALGGGMYSFQIPFANVSLSTFENVGAIALSQKSQAAGGGIFVIRTDELFVLKSSSFISTFLRVVGSQSYAVGGAFAMQHNDIISTKVSDCIILNSSVSAVGNETAALGGALFNYAKFDVSNVTIVACRAMCEGSQCFAAGGAYSAQNNGQQFVLATMPLLQVHLSLFSNNSATCNGTGSSRCSAQGGAIFVATSSMNFINATSFVRTAISSSLFIGNRVTCSLAVGSVSNGGAISCNTCGGHIINSVFHSNNVESFLTDKNHDVTVEISGGGLYASLQSPRTSGLLVSNTTFLNNSAFFNSLGLSGSGGGATVGFMADVSFVDCSFNGNIAHNGGGLTVESQGKANISNSIFMNNVLHSTPQAGAQIGGPGFYSSRGSAIFSANPTKSKVSSSSYLDSTSQYPVTLQLYNCIIIASENANTFVSPSATGSLIFLVGLSQFSAYNTSVHMRSAASALEISGVESGMEFFSELVLSCNLGYLLQKQVTSSSLLTISNVPSLSVQFPPVPVSVFTKLSGLSASCSPCLANTYSFKNSATIASNQSSCTRCPFGADCNGTWVTALPGFWGWFIHPTSANELIQEFVLLPDGYACGSSNLCVTFDQCIPSRSGILCGSCAEGFTRSIVSKSCVPTSTCSTSATVIWTIFAITMILIYAVVIVFSSRSASSGVFQTLMWFYQIAGLLLSGGNSLETVPGVGSVSSILSMVFSASLRPPSGGNFAGFSGICLVPNMSQVDILMVGVLCHALLLVFVLGLSLNCVFAPCERAIQSVTTRTRSTLKRMCQSLCPCASIDATPAFEKASQHEVSMLDRNIGSRDVRAFTQQHDESGSGLNDDSNEVCHYQMSAGFAPGSSHPFAFHDSIGRSLIMLPLTVFVSSMTALVQCISCLTISGYPFPPGESENRWYYDGTQQCAGTRFTLASVLLAPFFCFPVFLFYRMQKLIALDDNTSPGSLTAVQGNALRYCMPPPHEPSVFHSVEYFQIALHFLVAAATGW
jgi:hypothetical protein